MWNGWQNSARKECDKSEWDEKGNLCNGAVTVVVGGVCTSPYPAAFFLSLLLYHTKDRRQAWSYAKAEQFNFPRFPHVYSRSVSVHTLSERESRMRYLNMLSLSCFRRPNIPLVTYMKKDRNFFLSNNWKKKENWIGAHENLLSAVCLSKSFQENNLNLNAKFVSVFWNCRGNCRNTQQWDWWAHPSFLTATIPAAAVDNRWIIGH